MAYNISLSGRINMAGYTKEFLVDAYLSRFLKTASIEDLVQLEADAIKLYDRVGKDQFRKYASLDAEAIANARTLVG
jgi:hypothetical protein